MPENKKESVCEKIARSPLVISSPYESLFVYAGPIVDILLSIEARLDAIEKREGIVPEKVTHGDGLSLDTLERLKRILS